MSTSAETVKNGIVVADSTIRRAIVACVAVSSTMLRLASAAGCGCRAGEPEPAAELWTSSRVIRPPGPVPAMPWSETPSSTAVRRATGVASGTRAADAPLRRPARTPAVAVRERRDRLTDRDCRSFGNEDRVERAVGLGLVDDRRLVRLDLDQALAAREGLTRRLQPTDDDGLGHRVRQLGHRQLVRHCGSQPLNSRAVRPVGNGAASPRSRIRSSSSRHLALESVERRGVDALRLELRAEHDDRIARPPLLELALHPIGAGIAARVPDEAIRQRLDERRPVAATRMSDCACRGLAHAPRRSSRRSSPPERSMTSARARISPAVTERNAVYSP